MVELLQLIRRTFRENLPGRKQLIAWLVSLGLLIVTGAWTLWHSEPKELLIYALILYLLDSFIFFALFHERPKMKLVMLTFIFLLEIAVIGYYLLVTFATS